MENERGILRRVRRKKQLTYAEVGGFHSEDEVREVPRDAGNAKLTNPLQAWEEQQIAAADAPPHPFEPC